VSDGHMTDVGDTGDASGAEVGGASGAGDLFAANLAAMTSLSSHTACRLRNLAPSVGVTAVSSTSGHPVLLADGRALDSRRNPVSAAQQAVSGCIARHVALFGLGTGYVAEALIERGIGIGAVIERLDVLAAAMRVRDLTALFAQTPVHLVDDIADRAVLAKLRAVADVVVTHAPSVQLSPALGELARRWDRLPKPRAPRVLVVGPTSGGSLGTATFVADAVRRSGAEFRMFDASPFATAQRTFGALPVTADGKTYLQGRFALLLGEAIVGVAAEWRPDLVIALAQSPLTQPALEGLSTLGATTAFWFVENVRVLPYWRDVVSHYHHVFAIQPGAVLDQMRAAGAPQVHYLPMACDPRLHTPVPLGPEDPRFASPVSFAGAPYLNRRHILGAVADLGLTLWGDGWERTPLASHVREAGRFDLQQMLKVFSGTGVNLNVHSADHVTGLDPDPDYVNPRTFELAACGAFQLVDHREPLASLFNMDEIVAFRSVREMRQLTEHYLAHPDQGQEIASRARARAIAEHTYDHRVADMFAKTLPAHLQPDVSRRGFSVASLQPSRSLEDAIAEAAAAGAELSMDEAVLRMLANIRDTVWAR
jgi:spore maturation protein CgeB